MLPDGIRVTVNKNSYDIPPIFGMLSTDGDIEEHMMYNTFNMGIGMVLCVDKDDVDKTIAAVTEAGEDAYVIGEAKAGDKGVDLC